MRGLGFLHCQYRYCFTLWQCVAGENAEDIGIVQHQVEQKIVITVTITAKQQMTDIVNDLNGRVLCMLSL